MTLAYHFQASHLPTLEKLAQNIDVKLGCDWVATIFSRDIRFANHEVMFPVALHIPRHREGTSRTRSASCWQHREMESKGK